MRGAALLTGVLGLVFCASAALAGNGCLDALGNEPLRPEEIHYRVSGPNDGPPLVLIHGLGGSSRSFVNIVPILEKKFRVIQYDQRGHGYTAQRGWDYSLDVMASDLRSLLDHLKIERAHLLGLSFGARTAMQFSLRYPERVRSLLVEDMEMIPRVVDYHAEYLEKARRSEHLPRYFPSREAAYRALREFYSHWEAEDALESSELLPDGRFELLHRPHGMFLYDLGGNGADLTEPLKRFKAPLLFVRADPEQSMLSEAGVAHIRRHRPDVRIETVWDSVHVIHATHPKTFLRLAEAFFENAR